jgi:heavy metal sensor kinase
VRLGPASIRTRLTAWYAGAVAIAVALYALAALLVARQRLYAALDSQLHEDREVVEHLLRREADGTLRLGEGDHGGDEALAFTLVAQAEDGRVLCTAPEAPPPAWQRLVGPLMSGIRSLEQDGETVRVFSGVETIAGADVVLHVARSERPLRDDLNGLLRVLLLLLPLAAAGACLGGFLIARRALRPLTAMTEHARRISAEQLGERLPGSASGDELGRLGAVFNDMLARLENSFAQLRRFTADASHELRTPLTALRAVGEVSLHGEQTVDGCREVIGSMLEEVDRMSRLVDTLLLLARADSKALPLEREPVDLGELAREVVATLAVLADEKRQRIDVAAAGAVRTSGDRTLLRQALLNLVHNAIKHTQAGGAIAIAVAARDGAVECDVRDSGPGIPPEHRARLFERFYRADPARARATGGAGLGLALARSVAELHGGTLELARVEPACGVFDSGASGCVFRMRLPAEPPP